MPDTKKHYVVEGLFDAEALLLQREWDVLREGVNISIIYDLGDQGPRAAFLHYVPGASVPVHEHIGYEHIIVLHGSQQDEKGIYGKGSLLIHSPESKHGVRSPEGCIALGIWQKPVRFE